MLGQGLGYIFLSRGTDYRFTFVFRIKPQSRGMGDTTDTEQRFNLLSRMPIPKKPKGKQMSNMLTNGAIFSTLKQSDSRTVRGRPSRKDGVVILFMSLYFETSSSAS